MHPASRLNDLLNESGSPPLTPQQSEQFNLYLNLLLKWNARTNLTAIRDEEGILSRHFVESILCARYLPENIVSLLDFGSGPGFPGIPISIIRKDLAVILAESQNKKSAFLREAVRTLNLPTHIHSGRAEELKTKFDCITMRAVDNMTEAIPAAVNLLNPSGWLLIMTTAKSDAELLASGVANWNWRTPPPCLGGDQRILLAGQIVTRVTI